MSGVILALLSAVFIALFQIVLRKSTIELKPSVAFFYDAMFGLLLWVPLALVMGVNFEVGVGEALYYAVISAILSEALVFYALSHGELSITATILATYPVYTVLLSRAINDEVLSVSLTIFVAVTIVGSIWATYPEEKKAKYEFKFQKAIFWPFLAAVAIGLSDTISKGYINRSDDFSLLFMLGIVQVPVALVYLKIEKQSVRHTTSMVLSKVNVYKSALLAGLLNIVGTGFLWLSFSYTQASIASPITGASGALTVLLAYFILKDRLSVRQYLAITITFIGIIGISILNN